MTPGQFQVLITAWVVALTVLVPILFALLRLILSEWRSLSARANSNTVEVATLHAKAQALDVQVNGSMTDRITSGANAAIQADKAIQS